MTEQTEALKYRVYRRPALPQSHMHSVSTPETFARACQDFKRVLLASVFYQYVIRPVL